MRKEVGIDFRIPVANLAIVHIPTYKNSSSKTREQKIDTGFY